MSEFDGPDPDAAGPGAPVGDPRHPEDAGHLLLEPAPARRRRGLAALSIAAAVVLTIGAGAGAWAAVGAQSSSSQATGGAQGGSGRGSQGFGQGGQGFGPPGGGPGQGGQGFGGGSTPRTTAADPATAEEAAGVVVVESRLGYQSAAAAGTGVVLTATGRVLTNNHVIDGSTAIRVTDPATDRSWTAQVVGTNPTRDIAVLQLEDASGLTVAALATRPAAEGDAVTGVGNAGGTGSLTAVHGTVTDLDRRITTRGEDGTAGEALTGLIETDADVVSGDSGGPLRNADHEVVGVDTAATTGTDDPTGYAIPIAQAVSIAEQIVAGDDTDEITIGLPAFLGVSIVADADDATIDTVIDGTAAAATDLAAGDTITAVDGRAVGSAEALTDRIRQHRPGDRVRIAVEDPDGAARTVTATLQEGPAD